MVPSLTDGRDVARNPLVAFHNTERGNWLIKFQDPMGRTNFAPDVDRPEPVPRRRIVAVPDGTPLRRKSDFRASTISGKTIPNEARLPPTVPPPEMTDTMRPRSPCITNTGAPDEPKVTLQSNAMIGWLSATMVHAR